MALHPASTSTQLTFRLASACGAGAGALASGKMKVAAARAAKAAEAAEAVAGEFLLSCVGVQKAVDAGVCEHGGPKPDGCIEIL